MENIETGKDKIKKICEILKNETLDPAKQEAREIVSDAEKEAIRIIKEAEKKSEAIAEENKKAMEKERALFLNALKASGKQVKEQLRQEIENKIFKEEIVPLLSKIDEKPEILASLINALISAIEKEGTSADFSAYIGKGINPEKVNGLVLKQLLDKLREKSVVVGTFGGGVQIKLHDKKMALDISEAALQELLGRFLRKDFRKILFADE